ncbi:cytochrome c3 family protein [Falsiroseomonas sp. CW058]|uniref:cytochrome c3 family protein n=1 Tax=Falsiroseomonas sp. CW058 TaxID=3388664 RepID=UPI003D31DA0E
MLGALGALATAAAAFAFVRSDRAWGVGEAAPQPIPYSHQVHVGQLGLDCRYCHAGVERAAAAGMPTAETCLGCHRAVWNVTAQFAPLESALALGAPVVWSSVHRLPEHVRFHHGAHVAAGLGCGTCHGEVQAMPRTVKVHPMSMGWCLDCHRDPRARLPPEAGIVALPGAVADAMGPGASARAVAAQRVEHFGVEIPPLTRCSTCHR